MALSIQRDTVGVVAGLTAWWAEHDPAARTEVVGCERPSVGFSSETLLLDVRRDRGDGPRLERSVVKLAPPGPAIFPSYDFVLQARVQEAVAAAGVPAPAPAIVEDDLRWVGAPFLVMPAIDGHVIGEVPLRDPWLTSAGVEGCRAVHHRYLDTVADIHRIDWRRRGLAEVVPRRDNLAELAHWRDYLAWYGDGTALVADLVAALDWCADHRPSAEPEPSLRWGDVRMGNVIFDEDRSPVAVLDWEMATIGSAEHDLAWALTLESIQAELLGRAVPGFLGHDEAVRRYEGRLGRAVRDLEWYEVLALVCSTAVMTRIAHLSALDGRPPMFPLDDNPILAILRRRIAGGGR